MTILTAREVEGWKEHIEKCTWITCDDESRMVPSFIETLSAALAVVGAAKWLSERLHSDGGVLPAEIDNLDESLKPFTQTTEEK